MFFVHANEQNVMQSLAHQSYCHFRNYFIKRSGLLGIKIHFYRIDAAVCTWFILCAASLCTRLNNTVEFYQI